MAKKKNVADVVIESLIATGVKRIYGISADSLNGITDSIREHDKDISRIHVRHEETAAFAAGAEAHLTGNLAVCAGSCGPGNTHLVNGLYDCHRNRVPVLAIAAHIPVREIGSTYFQETHPELLFKECSQYCELISHPEQVPRVLEIAIRTAVSLRGVAIVVLPGDIALQEAVSSRPFIPFGQPKAMVRPSKKEIARLTEILNSAQKVTILGGAGCAGDNELGRKIKDYLMSRITPSSNDTIYISLSEDELEIVLEKLGVSRDDIRKLLRNFIKSNPELADYYSITEFDDMFVVGIPRSLDEMTINCEMCGYIASSEEGLNAHKRTHGLIFIL